MAATPRTTSAKRLKPYVLGPAILVTLLAAALALATAVSLAIAPSAASSPTTFAALGAGLVALVVVLCKTVEIDADDL